MGDDRNKQGPLRTSRLHGAGVERKDWAIMRDENGGRASGNRLTRATPSSDVSEGSVSACSPRPSHGGRGSDHRVVRVAVDGLIATVRTLLDVTRIRPAGTHSSGGSPRLWGGVLPGDSFLATFLVLNDVLPQLPGVLRVQVAVGLADVLFERDGEDCGLGSPLAAGDLRDHPIEGEWGTQIDRNGDV